MSLYGKKPNILIEFFRNYTKLAMLEINASVGKSKIKHDYIRIFSLTLTSNAKLAQSGRYQSKTQEVRCSILSVSNFLLKYFCYPRC